MNSIINILEFVDYINSNISEELTTKHCSQAANMSTSYYIETFTQIMGFSPYQYIKKRRLELSTQPLLRQTRILDIAVENGYGSNEAYTRAFLSEYGITPSKYREAGITCTIEELSDIEKFVAFLPAPNHKQYLGDLYYQEYKDVYDALIEKGYFDKNTLDYRLEAKQLTEKYSYDFCQLILSVMKISKNLSALYTNVMKIKPIPEQLFYRFVREMVENGLLRLET
jgi:AraC-like DNA-binding protein